MTLSSFIGLKAFLGLTDFSKYEEVDDFTFQSEQDHALYHTRWIIEQCFKVLPPKIVSTSGHIYLSSDFKKTDNSTLTTSQIIENDVTMFSITICHSRENEYKASSFCCVQNLEKVFFKIDKPGFVLDKVISDLYPKGETILETLTIKKYRTQLYHGLVGILT